MRRRLLRRPAVADGGSPSRSPPGPAAGSSCATSSTPTARRSSRWCARAASCTGRGPTRPSAPTSSTTSSRAPSATTSSASPPCSRRTASSSGIFTVSQIVRGYFQSAYLGYYANARHAGKGLMTEAMELVLDHAFGPLSLHRLEANIQPGNAPSIALARGAGFRLEGYSPRYLLIGGRWRDHERYAITADEHAANRAADAAPNRASTLEQPELRRMQLRLRLGLRRRLGQRPPAPAPPAPPRPAPAARAAGSASSSGMRAKSVAQDLEHRRRVERRRRVVERVQPHVARPDLADLLAPVEPRDAGPRVVAQQLRREVAERADDARLDQLELAEQVVLAGVDLARQRIAVAGRPALRGRSR